MSDAYLDTERRMAEAVSAWNSWNSDAPRSIRTIAREFNVGRSALTNRLHGGRSRSTRPPTNRTLTEAQELAICHYIQRLDQRGQSPKLSMVEGAANYLLEQAHLDSSVPPPKVSERWSKRFVDRHPLYFKRKQKPLAAERDNAAVQNTRIRQPTPPHSPESEWHSRTPRSCKEFIDFSLGLQEALKDNDAIQKPYQKHLNRLVRGALVSAHSLEISNRELELIHRTAVSKAASQRLDGRVAQTGGGVISVREVRAKASKHDEDELAKATMVYEKAVGAQQEKQQAGLNAEKKVWKGLFSEARLYLAARKKLEVDRRKRTRALKKSIACKK